MSKKLKITSNYDVDIKQIVEKEVYEHIEELVMKLSMEHKRNINVEIKVNVD